jgi:nitrogen-specific signal transduction histidine kinase
MSEQVILNLVLNAETRSRPVAISGFGLRTRTFRRVQPGAGAARGSMRLSVSDNGPESSQRASSSVRAALHDQAVGKGTGLDGFRLWDRPHSDGFIPVGSEVGGGDLHATFPAVTIRERFR